MVLVRALAVLAAGAELQRCLRRPLGAAGVKLELPMAAMGAAAAIAGAIAAANALVLWAAIPVVVCRCRMAQHAA